MSPYCATSPGMIAITSSRKRLQCSNARGERDVRRPGCLLTPAEHELREEHLSEVVVVDRVQPDALEDGPEGRVQVVD